MVVYIYIYKTFEQKSTCLFLKFRLFKQRCLHMMDEMCKENANQSSDLMATGAIVWGIFSSPLNFAHEHFLYDVLAHVCSQKNISKRWYNDLPPNLRPYLKVKNK